MNPVGAGALGTIAFAALVYVCVPDNARLIEDDLITRCRTALLRAGFPADGLTLDGRDALLTGPRGSVQTSWQAQRIVSEVEGVRQVDAKQVEPYAGQAPPAVDPAVIAGVQEEISALMRRGVEFEAGTARLTAGGQTVLDDVSEVLKKYSQFPVEIQGYADNEGDPAATMELSRRRAATVRIYLIANGVASTQLTAAGYGQPGPKSGAAAGRAGRRIQFLVKAPR